MKSKNEANIYVGKSKDKGKTYFAKKDFKKGEFVLEILGNQVNSPTDYTIPIGDGLFINPEEFGGKYLNDYNLDANLGFKTKTTLIAIRDINKDEEIGPAYFMFVPFYVPKSTGENLNLSSYVNLSKENKLKFKEYFSEYLLDRNQIKLYEKFL